MYKGYLRDIYTYIYIYIYIYTYVYLSVQPSIYVSLMGTSVQITVRHKALAMQALEVRQLWVTVVAAIITVTFAIMANLRHYDIIGII